MFVGKKVNLVLFDASTYFVTAPPNQNPSCTTEPAVGVVGEDMTLVCQSQGGVPPAQLSWKDYKTGDMLTPSSGLSQGTEGNNQVKTLRHRISPLRRTDNDRAFVCTATNVATQKLELYLSCEKILNVTCEYLFV